MLLITIQKDMNVFILDFKLIILTVNFLELISY